MLTVVIGLRLQKKRKLHNVADGAEDGGDESAAGKHHKLDANHTR